MAYQIKDEAVLRDLRHLAKTRKTTVADVLRDAVKHEVQRERKKKSAKELLQPMYDKLTAMGKLPVAPLDWEEEKRISDEMWGE
jgi:hypothetical protein